MLQYWNNTGAPNAKLSALNPDPARLMPHDRPSTYIPAIVTHRPFHDPDGERLRS